MTELRAKHSLSGEERDRLPYDIRALRELWPGVDTEHILLTLGQLRKNWKVVAVPVAADEQQGERAGYMLPAIDKFLHTHPANWQELLTYGSDTADIVQNMVATHRLELVKTELAAGLWVSGTAVGELPERGGGQQHGADSSQESMEVEGIDVKGMVMGPDRLLNNVIQKVPVLGQEDVATMAQSIILALTDQDCVSITHVAQHTLLLTADSGYLQSVRAESDAIIPGRPIPFATLPYSVRQRQTAAGTLKLTTESRAFVMARRAEVALRRTDAAWTKEPVDKACGLPVLSQILPMDIGQVGVVAGELLDELQQEGSIIVAEGRDCWVFIQASCFECSDGTRVSMNIRSVYGRTLPPSVQSVIPGIKIGQGKQLTERLDKVEAGVCKEAIRAIQTPFYIPAAELTMEGKIITESWSLLVPLPYLQTPVGKCVAQDFVLELVDSCARGTRAVQKGVVVLNPDKETELAELEEGDEAWGKVDFTKPNPLATLMEILAKRGRDPEAEAGDSGERGRPAKRGPGGQGTPRDMAP